MKAKINYRRKRAIMITCIATILLIAAILGTVIFLRGNKNISAATLENNTSTAQIEGVNTVTDGKASQSNDNLQNLDFSVLPNIDDNTNETLNNIAVGNSNNDIVNADTNNSSATINNTELSNSTSVEKENIAETTTAKTNSQNVPNKEYTQTTVIPGRKNVLEYKSTQIAWNPIKIKTDSATSELKVYENIIEDANISIKKEQRIGNVNVDENGKTSDGKQIKVEPNTKITYTISVENKGNIVQKNVVVTDEMTKISNKNYTIKSVKVNGSDRDYTKTGSDISIGNLGIGQTAIIITEYTVSEDDMSNTEGTIKNKVFVNKKDKDGKTPTDEVNVPTEEWKADIDVVKSSKLYRNGKKVSSPAMYGDIIKYTITATNVGKKDGNVKVKDTVPDGTKLIRTKDSTNLSKDELDALETKDGLSKILDVKGKNGVEVIYFEVEVTARASVNIKNTATIDDNTPKSDDGYVVEKNVTINAKTTSMAEKNITIVLDLSSSMEFTRLDAQSKKLVTRLDDAKSAIKTFITDIYKKAENKNVKINLVTFNYKDKEEAGQYYYKDYDSVIGTKLYAKINVNNYKTKIDDINLIKLPNGSNGGLGTNISAGLNKANELTSGKKENNIVILLGDGDPTNGIDSKANAENTANILKKKATLYTISFGRGKTADPEFMKKIATDSDSKHAFTSSNASELSKNFDAIYNDEKDQYNGEKVVSNEGKVKLLIPDGMQLDLKKGIVIEINGVKQNKITSLPSNEITTDKDGNIIWAISGYDANATLNIYYYLK